MIGPAGCMAAPKQEPRKAHEHDIHVQCTRCRNKHMESDRIESAPDKLGMRTMTCPRCSGHNYYRLDADGKRCR
jgi:predicted nucleic-acid-binding Zn-ribbon protein